MAEYYKHIFVSGNVKPEKYKASPKPGKQPLIPPRDRVAHSEKLLQQFDRFSTSLGQKSYCRKREKFR